jgi:integrase
MATRLTDAIVKRLPRPEKGSKVHYDGDLPGFGCRVTAAGARSFILNYCTRGTGRERRLTIGSATVWRTTAAREEAKRLKQEIDRGVDPLGDLQEQRAAPTVAELCDRFEAEHLPRKAPSTAGEYRRSLRNHVRPFFGLHTKVGDVAFADIDRLHRRLTAEGKPFAANRTLALVSKMFSLAVRWGMRSDNPCRNIERNYEGKRRRYLSGDELERLTKALAEHPDKQAADIIRLLLLTGCRRGEALSMRWADVDLTNAVWSKPGSTTKQRSDHIVPLSAPARQLLSDIAEQTGKRHALPTFVFPSALSGSGHRTHVKRDWRQLCRAAGITGLRVHDLRHSFASQLASGGASLPLIGALLGHATPTTTARYAHLFDDPQRAATERVGAIIEAAGKASGENVTPFKGGRRA